MYSSGGPIHPFTYYSVLFLVVVQIICGFHKDLNIFTLFLPHPFPTNLFENIPVKAEPEFVNVEGAQESISRNQFCQPIYPDGPIRLRGLSYRPARLGIDFGLHKRFTNSGSDPFSSLLLCCL